MCPIRLCSSRFAMVAVAAVLVALLEASAQGSSSGKAKHQASTFAWVPPTGERTPT
jgi:hypothetical protein